MSGERESLLPLRNRISSALWDDGDKGRADEALMALYHRAEQYEDALRRIAKIPHNVPTMPSATQMAEGALNG